MAGGLLASWRASTCTLSSKAVALDYTAIGEPQTRLDVASGTTDTGLVIDPLAAKDEKSAGVVYSPVSITGLVVAFQVDDANGRPVTSMRLNARLVAKLITASYRSGGDAAVTNNPVNLFRDPEFLKLNPGVAWPGGAPGNHPLLLGDLSDTTEALTRWIWHDPQARAFIKGTPDPWGMKVNANYKNVGMPFSNYPLLDQVHHQQLPAHPGHGRPGPAAVHRPVPGRRRDAGERGERHHQAAATEPGRPRGDRDPGRRRRGPLPAPDRLAGEHRRRLRDADDARRSRPAYRTRR